MSMPHFAVGIVFVALALYAAFRLRGRKIVITTLIENQAPDIMSPWSDEERQERMDAMRYDLELDARAAARERGDFDE